MYVEVDARDAHTMKNMHRVGSFMIQTEGELSEEYVTCILLFIV